MLPKCLDLDNLQKFTIKRKEKELLLRLKNYILNEILTPQIEELFT